MGLLDRIAYRYLDYRSKLRLTKDIFLYGQIYSKDKSFPERPNLLNTIPKKINYVWLGGNKKPDLIKRCINSWHIFLPDWEIKEWNESNFPFNEYEFSKGAMQQKRWAFAADVARIHAVYFNGGICLDTDMEVLKPLEPLLNQAGFACREGHRAISFGVVGAVQYHPLLRDMLLWYKHIKVSFDYGDISSTRIMAKIIKQKYNPQFNKEEATTINHMTIYPESYFLPHKIDENKFDIKDNTYTIHYGTGLW